MPVAHGGINLASQGISLKMLFSGYLTVVGVGYLMALVQILFTHGMADGKFGLSIEDIVYSYYGNRSGSILESQLNGSMKPMAPEEERFRIIQWVRDGAEVAQFEEKIQPVFEQRCVACHNADSGMGIPDFKQIENVLNVAQTDTGATFASLTRVSHIHLFGIAFIFMFVGLIFSLASGVPIWLKATAIIMPYIFLLVDIASWWLTKLNANFAWLVMIGGSAMALSFAFMWCVSMYEMWIMPRLHPDIRDALHDE